MKSLLKLKLQHLAVIIAAFLAPVKFILIAVGAAILFDTVLGLLKAKKQKEKITSRKLSNVIAKMALYEMAVVGIFILDKFLLSEFVLLFTSIPFFLTKVTAAVLVVVELVSVHENFEAITGINIFEKAKGYTRRAKELKEEIAPETKE